MTLIIEKKDILTVKLITEPITMDEFKGISVREFWYNFGHLNLREISKLVRPEKGVDFRKHLIELSSICCTFTVFKVGLRHTFRATVNEHHEFGQELEDRLKEDTRMYLLTMEDLKLTPRPMSPLCIYQ